MNKVITSEEIQPIPKLKEKVPGMRGKSATQCEIITSPYKNALQRSIAARNAIVEKKMLEKKRLVQLADALLQLAKTPVQLAEGLLQLAGVLLRLAEKKVRELQK